jgi:hypothetical protein
MHMAFEPQANTPNEKMPNPVDDADNKSRNHIPLDMLGIPKPILGTNDDVKTPHADISSLVTMTFDLI